MILCLFSKIVVADSPPGAYELANHGLLAGFTETRSCEVSLNSEQRVVGYPRDIYATVTPKAYFTTLIKHFTFKDAKGERKLLDKLKFQGETFSCQSQGHWSLSFLDTIVNMDQSDAKTTGHYLSWIQL